MYHLYVQDCSSTLSPLTRSDNLAFSYTFTCAIYPWVPIYQKERHNICQIICFCCVSCTPLLPLPLPDQTPDRRHAAVLQECQSHLNVMVGISRSEVTFFSFDFVLLFIRALADCLEPTGNLRVFLSLRESEASDSARASPDGRDQCASRRRRRGDRRAVACPK